jgi:hypothetical protein
MRCIAYAGGVTPADRLTDATVVVDDLRKVPQLLA